MSPAPFPFDFQVREPEPPLGRLVESIWYARGTIPYTRERIAPTGSTVAVFVLSDPIIEAPEDGPRQRFETGFLIGPHDRPVWNEPTGETYAVGIVTRAVGCEAVFGLAPAELRGEVVELQEAWPRAAALREQLLAAASPQAKLDVIEDALAGCHVPDSRAFARCEAAVALLVTHPTRPISAIAEQLTVSHAHLVRQFTQIVGLAPRTLARLLRLRGLLTDFDVQAPPQWAELAAGYGWYDQAHFIRDFKRHTGVTPSRYVAAQRAIYGPEQPGEGAGFVPEV